MSNPGMMFRPMRTATYTERPDRTCSECGSRVSWYAAAEPFDVQTYVEEESGEWVWATQLHTGRYYCHNYGGCENAPG